MLVASWITAISTLIMAITGLIALNKWKDEQKRNKLINLLETLNSYIQELLYYEVETTIFSRHTRAQKEENFENIKLIQNQSKLIDSELAEGFGNCVLCLKNWLIDHENQNDKLNEINKNLQIYRIKMFDYINLKIQFFIEGKSPENILYDMNPEKAKQLQELEKFKKELETYRNTVQQSINDFKQINKKLLK